ncbi:hypothetical protein Vafri_14156 [Volvox africanus]|uniref:Uncharacterized protein n=1 Tax=Volvox africanus TaxID=51714 RepID=A0A8J4F3H1_9CHLO|nr:hypothetical protein Vafri_14156 [Volvox africanus]
MSCITAPPADDCWPEDDDEGEPVPVPAPPPALQRVFTPAVALPRCSRSTGDPDLAADDYALPARLVFGPLRAPCSDDWELDLGAGGDVIAPADADTGAELTLLPEAFKGVRVGNADGIAAVVTGKRTTVSRSRTRAVCRRGTAAQHASHLPRRQAVVEAPAGANTDMFAKQGLFTASAEMSAVATDVAAEAIVVPERAVATTASGALLTLTEGPEEGCSDESASGDDDEGAGGGAELHAEGGRRMCVIVRPPVPPASAVYPVLEELVELVHQHTLQPIKPALVEAPAAQVPTPTPTPTPTPPPPPPQQSSAEVPGGGPCQ